MKRILLLACVAAFALSMCAAAAAQSGQGQSEKKDEPAPTATPKAAPQTNTSGVSASPSTTAPAPAFDQSTASDLAASDSKVGSLWWELPETPTKKGPVDEASSTPAGQGSTGQAAKNRRISLLDAAPPMYHGIIRYPKFYGDPNMDHATIDGSFLDRQYLFGSVGGGRDKLAKHGLVIDASVTQVAQGVAAGSGDGARYFGSSDLWIVFDTARAQLWSKGLIYAHFEGNWSRTVKGTGALLPLNGDTIYPAAPSKIAVSELYLVQGLPSGYAVVAGKADWAAYADTSFFANNERTQFLYTGLINNAILGSFVPYTSLGVLLLKELTHEVGVAALVTTSNTKATTPGFSDICACALTYGVAASWTPKFRGKPGIYGALVGLNTKNITAFDVDKDYLIDEITGQVPIEKKNNNYAMTFDGSQYLKFDKGARRSDGLPVGIGPFFRFGIANKDRNLIDQFYSAGVGGNGGFAKRLNDNWGVGWAGSHFSGDLRRNVVALGRRVDSFEHAVETFYNFALTPAMRTSFHIQYINSANPARDPALVLAVRLQVDF